MTKNEVKKRLKAIGATLEEDEPSRTCRVFQAVAPSGSHWSDGDSHCLVILDYGPSDWADAANRISFGLSPASGCEDCNA